MCGEATMKSPFPGMDPYLEQHWRDVHSSLIIYARDQRRAWKPLEAEIYPLPLEQRLPSIRIPLRETDDDVRLDLQPLIDQAYANGRYGHSLDYTRPPAPPLEGSDAAWADHLLRQAGRRPN
jgi:hypothetical protein